MKTLYLLCFSLFFSFAAIAQSSEVSVDNYAGLWSGSSSWVDGSAPVSANIKGFSVTINGYITVNGGLSVANEPQASTNTFTIKDTLVVFNDFILENDAMPLVVPAGGVLVVFGNLKATNKIQVENGGIIAVKGTVEFTKSGQDAYTDTGGAIYSNQVSGNITAQGDSRVLTTLRDSADPKLRALYWFMMQRPDLGPITPLPVELLYFRSRQVAQGVQLEWASAKEWNFSHYTLERSQDGKEYRPLHIETVTSESYTTKTYAFIDQQPLYGANYYRLKATDIDGREEYKGVVLVYSGTKGDVEVSPNPAIAENIRIRYAGASEGTWVQLYNSTGAEVMKAKMDAYELILPVTTLPKGLYIVKIVSQFETKQARLVIK